MVDLRAVDPADDDVIVEPCSPRSTRRPTRRTETVIATAGHVDHGKSSLVLASPAPTRTGCEEEKRRGLTIDLGFAHTSCPRERRSASSTCRASPLPAQHACRGRRRRGLPVRGRCEARAGSRRPRNTCASWQLLGIRTRGDRTHQGRPGRRRLAGTRANSRSPNVSRARSSKRATVVAVSTVTGEGPTSSTALENRRRRPAPRSTAVGPGLGRPGVRRRGSGTVVTGTWPMEPCAPDQRMVSRRSLAARPCGSGRSSARSRGRADRSRRGLALNLVGVDHAISSKAMASSNRSDGGNRPRSMPLRVLAASDHDVSRRGAYLAYIGSGEFPVRVRGSSALRSFLRVGRVRCDVPVRSIAAVAGRPLRAPRIRADETVGGGEILDIDPGAEGVGRGARPHDRTGGTRSPWWVLASDVEALTGGTGRADDPRLGHHAGSDRADGQTRSAPASTTVARSASTPPGSTTAS